MRAAMMTYQRRNSQHRAASHEAAQGTMRRCCCRMQSASSKLNVNVAVWLHTQATQHPKCGGIRSSHHAAHRPVILAATPDAATKSRSAATAAT
jgi:hypothetical protein